MRIRASGVHVFKSEFRIWINNYICTDIWDVVTQACCKKQFSKIDLEVRAWMKDYFTENTSLHLFIIMKADLLFLCEGLVPLYNAVDVYEDAHNIHPIIYLAIEFKILMGSFKKNVHSLLMHWSYVFLALTNWYNISSILTMAVFYMTLIYNTPGSTSLMLLPVTRPGKSLEDGVSDSHRIL